MSARELAGLCDALSKNYAVGEVYETNGRKRRKVRKFDLNSEYSIPTEDGDSERNDGSERLATQRRISPESGNESPLVAGPEQTSDGKRQQRKHALTDVVQRARRKARPASRKPTVRNSKSAKQRVLDDEAATIPDDDVDQHFQSSAGRRSGSVALYDDILSTIHVQLPSPPPTNPKPPTSTSSTTFGDTESPIKQSSTGVQMGNVDMNILAAPTMASESSPDTYIELSEEVDTTTIRTVPAAEAVDIDIVQPERLATRNRVEQPTLPETKLAAEQTKLSQRRRSGRTRKGVGPSSASEQHPRRPTRVKQAVNQKFPSTSDATTSTATAKNSLVVKLKVPRAICGAVEAIVRGGTRPTSLPPFKSQPAVSSVKRKATIEPDRPSKRAALPRTAVTAARRRPSSRAKPGTVRADTQKLRAKIEPVTPQQPARVSHKGPQGSSSTAADDSSPLTSVPDIVESPESNGSPEYDDSPQPRPRRGQLATPASRPRAPSKKSKDADPLEEYRHEIPEDIVRRELDANLDPVVINLSFRLYNQGRTALITPKEEKPLPVGSPQVHAVDRQALCETLPYFNATQGGCCMKDGTIYGFMFDKGANRRDFTSSNVLLSRAGGGMENVDGKSRLKSDQEIGNQVLSFQQNVKQQTPIVIILGGNNPTAQSRLEHVYSVTGLWKPTDTWHEKDPKTGHTMIRYRFEIFNEDNSAWWMPERSENEPKLGACGPVHQEECAYCGKISKQVYLNGWMCLQNPDCKAYWQCKDGSTPNQDHMLVDARFLLQRTTWAYTAPSIPLVPELQEEQALTGWTYSERATKGVVCRTCGRCNLRTHFWNWQCGSCDWTYQMPREIIPAKVLVPLRTPFSGSYDPNRDVIHQDITQLHPMFIHGYRVNVYQIPGIVGWVGHAIPTKAVVELPHGANECFERLQETDIELERRSMAQKGSGDHRMGSFSRNYGQYYKFIADTKEGTSRIQDAPMEVRQSAKCMNELTNLIIDGVDKQLGTETKHEQFNEMLALGYMENMGMNFHDDGEELVGPTIATQSFGATSRMFLRMKEKYARGYSTGGVLTDDTVGGEPFKPKPFCNFYKHRLAVYEELTKLEGAELKNRKARLVQELKKLAAGKKNKGNKRVVAKKPGPSDIPDEADEENDVANVETDAAWFKSAKGPIQLKLRHGDIAIMHGPDIQQYYEHAVFHDAGLRFALTCRNMERNPHLGDPPYEITEDDIEWVGRKVPS